MERSEVIYVPVLKSWKEQACNLPSSNGCRNPTGVRGEKLKMCDIPVRAITSPQSCSPYSPGVSGAKHTASDHCLLSALKSISMAKSLAGHFQNVHMVFVVSNRLDDEL